MPWDILLYSVPNVFKFAEMEFNGVRDDSVRDASLGVLGVLRFSLSVDVLASERNGCEEHAWDKESRRNIPRGVAGPLSARSLKVWVAIPSEGGRIAYTQGGIRDHVVQRDTKPNAPVSSMSGS